MRVIAGRLRGRTLRAPKGQRTRPTSDRVRQALFAVLGDMTDLSVLDLYAGSGALGIEALSRGARHATFVESSRPAIAAIRGNLEALGLGQEARVLGMPVERSRRALGASAPFDLVLCDPPWADLARALDTCARLLDELLTPGARVAVEHPASEPVSLPGFEAVDARRWGDTGVDLFVRG